MIQSFWLGGRCVIRDLGPLRRVVLGMMSTGGNENPNALVKIAWGVLISAIAISMLLAGGLKSVQTPTIVFACLLWA